MHNDAYALRKVFINHTLVIVMQRYGDNASYMNFGGAESCFCKNCVDCCQDTVLKRVYNNLVSNIGDL